MPGAHASDEIGTAPVDDLEALQRHVSELAREAEAATQIHHRTAWIGYAAIFFALPFAVLLLRLHMQAWHYYVAGALVVAGALLVLALESAALAKCDRAIQAVGRAQEACEAASRTRT